MNCTKCDARKNPPIELGALPLIYTSRKAMDCIEFLTFCATNSEKTKIVMLEMQEWGTYVKKNK